ncbi:MAG: hypothetical protein WCJ56_01035 [bacterium]
MSVEDPEEHEEQGKPAWTPVEPEKELKPNYVAVLIVSVLLTAYSSAELYSLKVQFPYPGGLINQIDSGVFGLLGIFTAVGMLFRWPFAHKTAIVMILARILTLMPLTSFFILPPLTAGLSAGETQIAINDYLIDAFFNMAMYGLLLFVLTRPRVAAVFGRR